MASRDLHASMDSYSNVLKLIKLLHIGASLFALDEHSQNFSASWYKLWANEDIALDMGKGKNQECSFIFSEGSLEEYSNSELN